MPLELWVVLLLGTAILLGVLELFIPSFGLLTVLAGISLVVAVVVAFKLNSLFGLIFLVAMMVILPLAISVAFRIIPKTKFGQNLLLETPLADPLEVDHRWKELRLLINKQGHAISLMMPAGKVQIEDHVYDALSESEPIDPQSPIKVIRCEGITLIVRKIVEENGNKERGA